MNRIFTIATLALLVGFSACKKEPTAEDYQAAAKDIREKMCGKMEECSKEMLAQVPENMRKMMEARYTKESCMASSQASMQSKPENFKKEDLEKARICASAMAKASCADVKNHKVEGCEDYMHR